MMMVILMMMMMMKCDLMMHIMHFITYMHTRLSFTRSSTHQGQFIQKELDNQSKKYGFVNNVGY